MSRDPNDVVRVFAGSLIEAELYQQALNEAGIENKLVGGSLTAGLGSAIPGSCELWVHQGDAEKATAALKQYDEDAREPAPKHPHPTDE